MRTGIIDVVSLRAILAGSLCPSHPAMASSAAPFSEMQSEVAIHIVSSFREGATFTLACPSSEEIVVDVVSWPVG